MLMISYAAIGDEGHRPHPDAEDGHAPRIRRRRRLLVLHRFDWDPRRCSTRPPPRAASAPPSSAPAWSSPTGPYPRLDMISAELTVVLGGGCLPHVTMRMYTASNARQVRRSMSWAVSCVAAVRPGHHGRRDRRHGADRAPGDRRGRPAGQHRLPAGLAGRSSARDVSGAETLLFTTVTTAIFLTAPRVRRRDDPRLRQLPRPRRRSPPGARRCRAPRDAAGPAVSRAGRRRHRDLPGDPGPAPQPAAAGDPVLLRRRLGHRARPRLQPVLARATRERGCCAR